MLGARRPPTVARAIEIETGSALLLYFVFLPGVEMACAGVIIRPRPGKERGIVPPWLAAIAS